MAPRRPLFEVVISGISGKFPQCSSVDEFKEKLFANENLLISDKERWNSSVEENPFFSGKLRDNKFDAGFFGVHPTLARKSDPMMGLMLERSFEAMMDAGVNPFTLRGRNICVISATSLSDAEVFHLYETSGIEGLGMIGLSRTMMANRISYFFNFTGPSYNIDSTWSSSAQALEIAVRKVALGYVDSAIIVTANHMQYFSVDVEYRSLSMLAPDGKCAPFDAEAKGLARSESVVAFFIQRAQEAKRIYGSLVHAKSYYMGDKPGGYIKIHPQIDIFFKEFYSECNVNPQDLSYFETSSFCKKEYDAPELNAINNFFCKKKTSPLLIGSVKGNVGNTEAPIGLVNLVKLIIAMESGVIPPTINYNKPNPQVPALISGQLEPVTKATNLPGDLLAMNVMNFCGSLSHVLVKRNDKSKMPLSAGELPSDGLPRLVFLQARHEEGAKTILEKLNEMPTDPEFLYLVNSSFSTPIPAYLWRAYTISPLPNINIAQNMKAFDPTKRPVWFIFSGMGSQWSGMGRELLQLPVFEAAIDKCDEVLRPRGIDIKHILTSDDDTLFDNIINCFVGMSSVQIGLVDVLRCLGVSPDGMIGHSVGELGCAYADGCLTAQEMILAAYYRGKATLDSNMDDIKGMMAAVGMGYKEIKGRLPESIDVACRNSSESCTLSGPTEDVLTYVKHLKQEGLFAKAVSAGGVAYHSRYIKTIGPKLLQYLQEAVPKPKYRSSKWISSSVPQSHWDSENSKLCSAEYMTNNLLSPVLFEEACQHLPKNAVLIEIAPHGLLQAILRRSAGLDVINISLTSRTAQSNICYMFNSLGQLYLNSVDIDINALYPAISHPVSRGTPSLANLITWAHNDNWFEGLNSKIKTQIKVASKENEVHINSNAADYQLWHDYCIDDKVVVPTSQIMTYPWKVILKAKNLDFHSTTVVFEDVALSDQLTVDKTDKTLMVSLSPTSCIFEVSLIPMTGFEGSYSNIMTGKMFEVDIPPAIPKMKVKGPEHMEEVTTEEFYSLLAHFGLQLGSQFQVIKQILIRETECVAKVQWSGNVVTFMEALINIIVFLETDKQQVLYLPTYIKKLFINMPVLSALSAGTILEVRYNYNLDTLVSDGICLCGVSMRPVSRRKVTHLQLNEIKFQPYFNTNFSLRELLSTSLQLVADTPFGLGTNEGALLNVLDVQDDKPVFTFSQLLKVTNQSSDYFKITETVVKRAKKEVKKPHQIQLVFGDLKTLSELNQSASIVNHVYFLAYTNKISNITGNFTNPIFMHRSEDKVLVLLKKVSPQSRVEIFEIESADWLNDLRKHISKSNDVSHIIVSRKLHPRKVIPILAMEPFAKNVRTVFILDKEAPRFSLLNSLYANQLKLGLPVNILLKGKWGTLTAVRTNISSTHNNLDCVTKSDQDELEILCFSPNLSTFTLNRDYDYTQQEIKYVDYSGFKSKERIMGMAQIDWETKKLTTDAILKWSVPTGWTMEDAATVPVTYALAYFCIHQTAQVKTDENVLIHAGLSPLGQAMIAITLQIGGIVFTSVEKENEVPSLLNHFPTLNPKHIIVLEKDKTHLVIKKLTSGKGVEVVVNCFSGTYMQESLRILGYYSRFLHLSNIKIEDKENIGLFAFIKSGSFFGVSLENLSNCSNTQKYKIKEFVQKGIEHGTVQPFSRKRFLLSAEAELLRNLSVEKIVLSNKNISKLKNKSNLQCNPKNIIVIVGNKHEWLEIAEWLVKKGTHRLVVLTEDNLGGSSVRRFNKLMNRQKISVIMSSLERAESVKSAAKLLTDTIRFGQISHILCVNMDENCKSIKNLDLASRHVLPELHQFVILFGKGSEVSESRESVGLPVCSVKSDSPLQSCTQLLPYLSTLLAEDGASARFFTVSDNIIRTNVQGNDNQSIGTYLPSSLDDLYRVGVAEEPGFTEVKTRSPGYSHVRYSLLPVFILPGLGSESFQPLLQQLIHPAFCSSLILNYESVEKLTESLLKDLLKIQSQGPYNIVGDSWSGAVAIDLGCQLEAQGHEVELFLIDGTPSSAKDRIRNLCDQFGADLGTSLLAATLSLPTEVIKTITQLQGWEEKLIHSLRHVPDDDSVGRGLTALYNQLTAVQQNQRPTQLFKGRVTLISCREPSKADLNQLLQYCQNCPDIFVTGDQQHNQLISNIKTASIINENMAYSWKL